MRTLFCCLLLTTSLPAAEPALELIAAVKGLNNVVEQLYNLHEQGGKDADLIAATTLEAQYILEAILVLGPYTTEVSGKTPSLIPATCEHFSREYNKWLWRIVTLESHQEDPRLVSLLEGLKEELKKVDAVLQQFIQQPKAEVKKPASRLWSAVQEFEKVHKDLTAIAEGDGITIPVTVPPKMFIDAKSMGLVALANFESDINGEISRHFLSGCRQVKSSSGAFLGLLKRSLEFHSNSKVDPKLEELIQAYQKVDAVLKELCPETSGATAPGAPQKPKGKNANAGPR